MNRLDTYRRRHRFRRLSRRADIVLLALVFTCVLLVFVAVIPWSTTSAAVTKHGPLVNIVLTAALVIVTAFYVFIASATLKEMRVGRAVEIRPSVKLRLGNFVVRDDAGSSGSILRLEGVATFANYGHGIAVDVRAYLTIPWTRTGNTVEFVTSQLGDSIIPALEPGQPMTVPATSNVHKYPVSFPDEGFFEVNVSFEDVEANVYQIKQFYDLYPIRGVDPETQEWCCHLRFEDLRCILFRPGHWSRSETLDRDAERLLIERD